MGLEKRVCVAGGGRRGILSSWQSGQAPGGAAVLFLARPLAGGELPPPGLAPLPAEPLPPCGSGPARPPEGAGLSRRRRRRRHVTARRG